MELEKYKYNNSQTKLSTKGHDFTYWAYYTGVIVAPSC